MSRTLTKKERGFINDIADGMVGTHAALKNYDTKDYMTAAAIASENLKKPKIVAQLQKLGFDSNNAKRVVAEILNNESAENRDRLKASELVFKVNKDLEPDSGDTKTLVLVNLNVG